MRHLLDVGASVDILSPREHEQSLDKFTREFWTERAWAVKHIRLPLIQGTASGGVLSIGQGQWGIGPQAGFLWSIQRLVVWGLNNTDTVYFYFSNASGVPVWSLSGGSFGQTFGKLQLTMYGGDKLLVAGTITATGTISVGGEAIEVPQEMAWKLA